MESTLHTQTHNPAHGQPAHSDTQPCRCSDRSSFDQCAQNSPAAHQEASMTLTVSGEAYRSVWRDRAKPENTICSKPQSAWLPAHASLALPVLQRFMRFKTSTLLFLRPCRLPYVAFRSNKVWNRGNKDPAWTSHVDVCIDITGATMAASRQQVFLSAQMAIYLSAQMAKNCLGRMGPHGRLPEIPI